MFAFFANGAELLLKQVSRMETRIWLYVGTVDEKILGLHLVSADWLPGKMWDSLGAIKTDIFISAYEYSCHFTEGSR